MDKTAYQTGTIELMPYSEHREFCIVGVFAVDVAQQKLFFKILDARRTKRLTGFFPEIERFVFTQTLKSVHHEWDTLDALINHEPDSPAFREITPGYSANVFQAITYPREGMIQHKARGAVLTDDINRWLEVNFKKMVLRLELETVIPEEQKLTREITSYIKQLKLGKRWHEGQVGNETYHAKFPFTYRPKQDGQIERAIKPLFLGQSSPTKIIEHGDPWVQKVRRLNQFGLAPELLIFPVKVPDQENAELHDNAQFVVEDLKSQGVTVIEEIGIEHIKPFILTDDLSNMPLFS